MEKRGGTEGQPAIIPNFDSWQSLQKDAAKTDPDTARALLYAISIAEIIRSEFKKNPECNFNEPLFNYVSETPKSDGPFIGVREMRIELAGIETAIKWLEQNPKSKSAQSIIKNRFQAPLAAHAKFIMEIATSNPEGKSAKNPTLKEITEFFILSSRKPDTYRGSDSKMLLISLMGMIIDGEMHAFDVGTEMLKESIMKEATNGLSQEEADSIMEEWNIFIAKHY